jgi:peptidoglycan/xylan/chitin deacetylase (PgdA/CDA1 family)
MTDSAVWQPLLAELDRWQREGRVANLWLRDDDAVEPTDALDRFLDVTGRHGVPATLAVIPEHTGLALAHRLQESPGITVAVHGWSHQNHAGENEKKQELGPHRPAEQVLAELREGFSRLSSLHGSRFVPVLVPPWNRIDADLIPQLGPLGFEAVSVFGPERQMALRQINTHVDVIDWRGTRGGRETKVLVEEMVARLRAMQDDGDTLGLLTHHLVHDAAVQDFLTELFELTSRHAGCRWRSLADIL